jgi:hypothetical protein
LFRSILSRLGRALRVVAHDPEVERAGKGLAVIILVRLMLALGASAQLVEIVRSLVGA